MSNKTYWKMRNGKSISIDDMDLNHLRNALKMMMRVNTNLLQENNSVVDQFNALADKYNKLVKKQPVFQVNGDIASEEFFKYDLYRKTGIDLDELDEEIDYHFGLAREFNH